MNRGRSCRDILLGLLLGLLLTQLYSPAFATLVQKTFSAYTGVNVYVDDKLVQPRDAQGNTVDVLNYNGTVYLPIRAVGEALGRTVRWDGSTATAYVGGKLAEQPAPAPSASYTSDTGHKVLTDVTDADWKELERVANGTDLRTYSNVWDYASPLYMVGKFWNGTFLFYYPEAGEKDFLCTCETNVERSRVDPQDKLLFDTGPGSADGARLNADKCDWILKNIYHMESARYSTPTGVDGRYAEFYGNDGYYYTLAGFGGSDGGGYDPGEMYDVFVPLYDEVAEKTALPNGKYYVTMRTIGKFIGPSYGAAGKTGEDSRYYLIADLELIDGKRTWTFYQGSYGPIDLTPYQSSASAPTSTPASAPSQTYTSDKGHPVLTDVTDADWRQLERAVESLAVFDSSFSSNVIALLKGMVELYFPDTASTDIVGGTDPAVFDPLNRFSPEGTGWSYGRVRSDRWDWIVKNVMGSSQSPSASAYMYPYNGYYYFLTKTTGHIPYKASLSKTTPLPNGKYYAVANCSSDAFAEYGGFVPLNLVADLELIDGRRIWIIYKLDDDEIDLTPYGGAPASSSPSKPAASPAPAPAPAPTPPPTYTSDTGYTVVTDYTAADWAELERVVAASGAFSGGHGTPASLIWYEFRVYYPNCSKSDFGVGSKALSSMYDPMGRFSADVDYYRMAADKCDWILKNIHHTTPDHADDPLYAVQDCYYSNGYYYVQAGGMGRPSHEAKIDRYFPLSAGKVYVTLNTTHEYAGGARTPLYLIADLELINGKRTWTFYSISDGSIDTVGYQ